MEPSLYNSICEVILICTDLQAGISREITIFSVIGLVRMVHHLRRWVRELDGIAKTSKIEQIGHQQIVLEGDNDGGVTFICPGADIVKGIAIVDVCFGCCLFDVVVCL